MKTALEQAKAELEAKHTQDLKELEAKHQILAMLPATKDLPVICNLSKPSKLDPRAWICFHIHYDPDGLYRPVEILKQMEEMGWRMLDEAALVKWDRYRPSMEPCALSDAANLSHPRKYSYTDGWSVAPYWLTPNHHTTPEFTCFMTGPDGLTYRVSLEAHLQIAIFARKVQTRFGDWHFERGTARLVYPSTWATHNKSCAHVDTDQGISGAIYFELDNSKSTVSEVLKSLLD